MPKPESGPAPLPAERAQGSPLRVNQERSPGDGSAPQARGAGQRWAELEDGAECGVRCTSQPFFCIPNGRGGRESRSGFNKAPKQQSAPTRVVVQRAREPGGNVELAGGDVRERGVLRQARGTAGWEGAARKLVGLCQLNAQGRCAVWPVLREGRAQADGGGTSSR